MVTKENIQDYALKLMFRMKDDEFEAFEKEFETILKQMDLIGQIEGIENVEPQVFPFKLNDVKLREDTINSTLTTEDAVKNAKEIIYDEVKVPKVVGGGEA